MPMSMPTPNQNSSAFRTRTRLNAAAVLVLLCACLTSTNTSEALSTASYRTSSRLTASQSLHTSRTVGTYMRPSRTNAVLSLASASVDAADQEQQQQQYDERMVNEYLDQQVNSITPKTKSLRGSMYFYASYVIRQLSENRSNKAAAAKKGTEKTSSWRKLFSDLNEQRKNIVQLAGYNSEIIAPSFLFLLLGALMISIVPHFYSEAITCVASGEASSAKLMKVLSGLAITSTLGALFTGMRGSLFWIAGARANYNVRVKLHRNLLLQEAAFFDSNEVGYLLSRLNNDVNKIGMVISFHVNVVLRQFAQFLFGSVYLLRISPKLAGFAFGGIGLVAVVSAIYGSFARSLAERVQDTFADATAVAETSFSMSETIRAFNGVKAETFKYEGAQSRALDLEEVQAWAYGSHKFVSDTLQASLQVGLLFACWTVGRAGGLPAAKLTTFLFYTNFVLESSNEVGDQWAKIMGAIGASSSVFKLIQRIPSIRDPTEREKIANDATILSSPARPTPAADKADKFEPIIEMTNMTVTYGAMDNPALKGININIYPGDRVAIVGRSGSGKSSMLRSILRFYDPSSGSANVCGESLKSMTREDIASQMVVVEQEPHLFPMSLIDNILYGIDKDSVNEETGGPCYSDKYRVEVTECLKLSGLPVDPGNGLDLELDTRVGEGGRTLSGGQRQRAAIARALIRAPAVLLLDEPTAALDSESEKLVVAALQTAMEHTKTIVMVTHRLGVVRSLGVNRVIVLDNGEIAELGHPEELLRKENGLYASLAREQGIVAMTPEGVVTDVSHSFQ